MPVRPAVVLTLSYFAAGDTHVFAGPNTSALEPVHKTDGPASRGLSRLTRSIRHSRSIAVPHVEHIGAFTYAVAVEDDQVTNSGAITLRV